MRFVLATACHGEDVDSCGVFTDVDAVGVSACHVNVGVIYALACGIEDLDRELAGSKSLESESLVECRGIKRDKTVAGCRDLINAGSIGHSHHYRNRRGETLAICCDDLTLGSAESTTLEHYACRCGERIHE